VSTLGDKIRAVTEFNDRPMLALAREADTLERERVQWEKVARARLSRLFTRTAQIKRLRTLLENESPCGEDLRADDVRKALDGDS
jgi:hypothetical protein